MAERDLLFQDAFTARFNDHALDTDAKIQITYLENYASGSKPPTSSPSS
jgi:hypothetical protein